jgi:signal transduction histidine kinase
VSSLEKEMIIVFIIAITVVSVIFVMFTAVNENQENEKNLKKPMQKVISTEIETHEIRCVEQTSNFCAKYKVFKIIKE